jgi:hypothetical protein
MMSPLFKATYTLPSEANRTAVGRVRPLIAIVSLKPARGVVLDVAPVAIFVVPPELPKRRAGGATGGGVAEGLAADAIGTMPMTNCDAIRTLDTPNPITAR